VKYSYEVRVGDNHHQGNFESDLRLGNDDDHDELYQQAAELARVHGDFDNDSLRVRLRYPQ